MAKKIVRGITDIKDINNQDFDTNNVNDLLSDGEHNYIHRKKKDGSEDYHNLTNNLKTIQSDDTDLLTVTNYNNTTNSATIRPKHDAQKEQLLESTDETILISHGENGTEETTSVDVNPAKVLTHDNLESTNGTILISHGENGTAEKTTVDTNPQKVLEHENLISDSEYITLSHQTDDATTHIQTTVLKEELEELHQTKQDTLVAGEGITIQGNTISASDGGGVSSSIQVFYEDSFDATQHVVENELYSLITFTFTCNYPRGEYIITGTLKEQLEDFVLNGHTISNGAISISNDGTNMKLINSAPSENVSQQGTFTFIFQPL